MAAEEIMKRYSYFEWDGDFIMTKIFKRLRRINEKQKEGIKAIELSKIVYKCKRRTYYKVKKILNSITSYKREYLWLLILFIL